MTDRLVAHPTGPKGTTVRILGISGSGRRKSYNSALLEAAKELLPKDAVLESYDVSGLPLFNADLEAEPPASARTLKEKIGLPTPTLRHTGTQLLGFRCSEERDRVGEPAGGRQRVERQAGSNHERVHVRARRCQGPAESQADNG